MFFDLFVTCKEAESPAFCEMELNLSATCKGTELPEQIQQQDFVMKDNKLYETFPCSIYVAGFGSSINEEELKNYFNHFGVVTSVCLVKSRNFAFVEFDSPDSVRAVTKREIHHKLGEKKLYVRKKKDRTFTKKGSSEKSSLVPSELVASLKMCNTIEEQVERVYNTLRLSDEDIENRYNLCAQLELLLRPYYPQCSLTVFGSTANGFGFKGCDVDVLFKRNNHEEAMEIDVEEIVVPTVRDVNSGKFPLTSLNKLHKFDELRFIKKVLHQKCANFKEVILIPASNCPLLKITSKIPQLRCDLSNGPRFPLHNTSLLKFMGKLDRRVLLVMSVIRYWVKNVCKIVRLSSYAVSLIVVYFLQTRVPPVIPTIKFIQSKADVQVFESDYDCTVPALSDVEKIEASSNTQTAGDLIAEFFAYYEKFDFANCVICPLTGSLASKKVFESDYKIFKVGPLCVQDPFEIDRNITGNVTLSVVLRLIDCFHEANEVINRLGSDKWELSQLFQNTQGNTHEIGRKYEILHSTNTLPVLREKFNQSSYSDTVLNHIWLVKTTEILLDLLSHGLFFEYEIIDLAEYKCEMWRKKLLPKKCGDDNRNNMCPSTCKQGVIKDTAFGKENSDDVDGIEVQLVAEVPTPQNHSDGGKLSKPSDFSDIKPFLTAQFIVSNRTWVGRRVFKSKYQNLKISLDIERNISLEIMREWNQRMEEKLIFDIEFFEYFRGGYVTLFIRLKSFEFKPELLQIGKFLESHVAKIVESIFYSQLSENEL